jgi:outer membrane protein assembly factor BamB
MRSNHFPSPIRFFNCIIVALILSGCFAPVSFSQLSSGIWPMAMHDVHHTSRSSYVGPDLPKVKWEFILKESLEKSYGGGGVAIDTAGIIYIALGSVHEDTIGFLVAIYPDGKEKWRLKLDAGIPAGTTPAISADGTIYLHANGNEGNIAAPEKLYAINPDGTIKWLWQNNVAAFVSDYISSPVIGNDGSIYFGSMNTACYRIDDQGNFMSGSNDLGEISSVNSTLAIGIDSSIQHNVDGRIWVYSQDGEFLWKGLSNTLQTGCIDTNGTIYTSGAELEPYAPEEFYAYNADGSLKWRYTPSVPVCSMIGEVYWGSGLAISDSGPVFTRTDAIYSLSKVGKLRWKYDFRHSGITGAPIIDRNNTIYVSQFNEPFCEPEDPYPIIVALNIDGTLKWELPVAGGVCALGSDTTLYIISDNKLCAYGHDPSAVFVPVVPDLLLPEDSSVVSPLSVALSWSPSERAEKYTLQVAQDPTFWALDFSELNLTSNSFIINNLEKNSDYYWRVKAANEIGMGDWSEEWSFHTSNLTHNVLIPLNDQIKLYPNPVKNMLYIEGIEDEITGISVLSIEGKTLIQAGSGDVKQIDLSDLQNGIYIIRIASSKSILEKLIIKE